MEIEAKISENIKVKPFWRNNPKVRNCNVPVEMTAEQVKEFVKCRDNPVYFIKNYVKILNLDLGKYIPFNLYDYQENMVETFNDNRFVISKFPRQCGKSTTFIAFALHQLMFKTNFQIAILANKAPTSRKILALMKKAYEECPYWIKQGVEKYNEGTVIFENGSRIVAESTSADSIRGDTFNIIFLDEFAHIGANMAEEFFDSVYPTIASGTTTKVFIVSTPKGLNHFYKMWDDAENGKSKYIPLEIAWNDVPGRDEKYKEETIANLKGGYTSWLQEFECEFVGSSGTLINPTALKNMVWYDPPKIHNGVNIYDEPIIEYDRDGEIKYKHDYVIVVDVAEGKGLDYSAFSVIDITEIPYKQVATFRKNTISPLELPDIIYNAAKYYNNAYVLIELESDGGQVANALYDDLEYEYIMISSLRGRKGQVLGAAGLGGTNQTQLGVKMTKTVKRQGCSNLKDLIENERLIIHDLDTINELMNFVRNRNSYEAEEGEHDDMVMGLVLLAWAAQQDYFKDLSDTDMRQSLLDQRIDYMNSEMIPFPEIVSENYRSKKQEMDDEGNIWTEVDGDDPDEFSSYNDGSIYDIF